MRNAIPILFALLTVGCSTWTPKKTVTLHDVDAKLAATEGADLRYLAVPEPHCEGARGCRSTTTSSRFDIYQWRPLCDGKFCGTAELHFVDVTRAAAHVAFSAEQLVAAKQLLRSDELSKVERRRYEEFVYRTHLNLPGKLAATVAAFNELTTPARLQTTDEVKTSREYLRKAHALLTSAGPAPHSMQQAWK